MRVGLCNLESCLSVLDMVTMGSTTSVRNFIQVGAEVGGGPSLSMYGLTRFRH